MVLAFLAYLSSIWYFRIDLTSEKRYTLSGATKDILSELPGETFVQVYLEGDMDIGLKRLQFAIRDMLDEFRVYSGRKVTYRFINPSEETDTRRRNEIHQDLYDRGLRPTNVQSTDKEGGAIQKIIFPGAIVNYNGMEMPVNLLSNNPRLSASENLNRSIEGLEYELIQAIQSITSDTIYKVAFLEGHGELYEPEVESISRALSRFYTIDRGAVGGQPGILDEYAAVIIAKPTKRFEEPDKLVLDQYLMNGGTILWLIDPVAVDMDSLMYSSITLAFNRDLNLDDLLFKYGIRLNYNLVQDIQCAYIPVNTALVGNPPQYTPVPWLYFPVFNGENHPVSRNLNLIRSEFASEIDTVTGNGHIKKHFLLRSSPYSRIVGVPNLINLEDVKNPPSEDQFNRAHLPVAVLLEGHFESAFMNRMVDDIIPGTGTGFKPESRATKMIVISDGDIIRNDIRILNDRIETLPLGQDPLTQQTYGNKEFLLNAINYLVDDNGLLELRTREFRIRLLDRARIAESRFLIQALNTLLPVFLVVVMGVLVHWWRKTRYAR
jgi:ABC-2 type transport system permease protein